MKARVVKYDKPFLPPKIWSTCMATFHTCLDIGPIRLFIPLWLRCRVQWSACLPSTPTIKVRVPQFFYFLNCFKRMKSWKTTFNRFLRYIGNKLPISKVQAIIWDKFTSICFTFWVFRFWHRVNFRFTQLKCSYIRATWTYQMLKWLLKVAN